MADRIGEGLSIPDLEIQNLNHLSEIIYGLTGGQCTLEVVGGAKNKKWPRKDVDVTIEFPEGRGSSELGRAQDRLNSLVEMVESIEKASNGYFKKDKVVDPFVDAEFGGDDILAHSGSILLKPKKGTVIELVPIS